LKFKKDKDSMSEVSSIIPTGTRITVLQKTSLYDTITVSGTIKSAQTVNVTVQLIISKLNQSMYRSAIRFMKAMLL